MGVILGKGSRPWMLLLLAVVASAWVMGVRA